MRKIINISLPPPVAKTVKMAVKKGSYSSTSEFFRELLRNWQKKELLNEIKESRAEFVSGKGMKL
jgi:Arc/MetJ-type ribon-helix-helix transcriptional regulator